MPLAIAVWSHELTPGKNEVFIPPNDIRITNAALSDSLADDSGRSSVRLTYKIAPGGGDSDDEAIEQAEEAEEVSSTVLFSLTPGKIEQATLDLVLEEDGEYTFEVVGKNTIFLTGNYIDQQVDQVPYNDGDESELGIDEDAYDLRDVSSDVEVDPEEEIDIPSVSEIEDASHRIEEVVEKEDASKSRKRGRDSDAMDVAHEGEVKISKKEKKKNKKLKAGDGKAVTTGESAPEKQEKPTSKVNGETKKADTPKDKKEQEESTKEHKTIELASGLQIKDAKKGTGPAAKKGDMVTMRYIGKFQDGKVFDSNTKGKPFAFRIGAGEVIKGWDEGIAGMKAGGERLLIVPPNLGYGNRKIDGIPAGSTLRFECKLLSIK